MVFAREQRVRAEKLLESELLEARKCPEEIEYLEEWHNQPRCHSRAD